VNYILRVQEESSSFQNRNTDLVPGVYEGGLKVWECSVDMCRYFLRKNIVIKGHVLELGCGHGLPGIWILKQAIAKSQPKSVDCFVAFSDYNEFVIRDVTIPNAAVNIRDSCLGGLDSMIGTNDIENLLRENIAFGSGDWMAMSDLLSGKNTTFASLTLPMPPAIPRNGLFDCILASETTYSENSAFETAELLSRHMKPGTGVAYISTKRYYFGVGGGTKCLCDSLRKQKIHKFHIEILEVYDNGVGNIRELLLVKSLGLQS
jgi:predicted nicotinamide N-methyase